MPALSAPPHNTAALLSLRPLVWSRCVWQSIRIEDYEVPEEAVQCRAVVDQSPGSPHCERCCSGVCGHVSHQGAPPCGDADARLRVGQVCAPRQCNVGLLAYSPLSGGALTGKYIKGNNPKARFNLFPGQLPPLCEHADVYLLDPSTALAAALHQDLYVPDAGSESPRLWPGAKQTDLLRCAFAGPRLTQQVACDRSAGVRFE